jgi:carotenoid cleavage dioxygenase-like enzyme
MVWKNFLKCKNKYQFYVKKKWFFFWIFDGIAVKTEICELDPRVFKIFFFQIYKVDVDSRDISTWKEAGYFVSEPIFVPRPHCKDEDDGVLCVTLLNAKTLTNVTLLILNAKDLTEITRIKFTTEGSVAQAMHGLFTPNY